MNPLQQHLPTFGNYKMLSPLTVHGRGRRRVAGGARRGEGARGRRRGGRRGRRRRGEDHAREGGGGARCR